jgi:hypothetical protein
MGLLKGGIANGISAPLPPPFHRASAAVARFLRQESTLYSSTELYENTHVLDTCAGISKVILIKLIVAQSP